MMWITIIAILISITDVTTLVSIGAGMEGLHDWSRSLPYVNLIKQARTWGSASVPWDGNATSDPTTGWPTSDFGVVLESTGLDMGGRYLVYAKGNAEVSIDVVSGAYVTDKTYDSSTNTFTAFLNVPESTQFMAVSFRNTTGPGLQDIAVLQPGYNLTAKSNFTNLMLAHLSRFSIIRFMDWTGTNGNLESNWNDTTPINWARYTSPRHNPWQTIPYLANQINKPINIWINIPHNATNDYILNVARIMFSELDPTNNIYVEYSNEVWNWSFRQATDNLHAASDSVMNHGDPYHFNYDNCSNGAYWSWRRTAYQIKHIGDLFKTVFGEENVGQWKRVRPILGVQVAQPAVMIIGLNYLNAIHGSPANFLHGIAIAPYFELGPYAAWTNLTVDQVFDVFNLSIQGMLPEAGWSVKAAVGVHATYAGWYGLMVHGYEGGANMGGPCDNCSLEAKINAMRHPHMTDICVTYLNGWYRFGFEEMNWFVAGATPFSKSGSFGLLEDMRQEILIDTTTMFNSTSPVAQLPRPSPKLKAVDQVRPSTIEMNFGIPIPALNINATNFAEHREPYPDPYLRYLAANATFYYPLKITQSPIRINITVYTSENSNTLEGAINNGQFVRVQTPKTAGWEVFEPAPVMQFYINQTVVPSLVTFRLKTFESRAYNIRSFDVVLATD